jgi:hypothetical protein
LRTPASGLTLLDVFTTQPHAIRQAKRLAGDLACVRAEVVMPGLTPVWGPTTYRNR